MFLMMVERNWVSALAALTGKFHSLSGSNGFGIWQSQWIIMGVLNSV